MSTGQNVTTTWERDERHETLLQTLAKYKTREGGKDQPVFLDGPEAGQPKPLTRISIRIASDGSGRVVNAFQVRPDTDASELADEIWHWCHNHGKNYELTGCDPTYVLQFHWNREQVPQGEFPLQFRYQKTTGLGAPMMDMREERNQKAAFATQILQYGSKDRELTTAGYGQLVSGWQALGAAQDKLLGRCMDQLDKKDQVITGLVDQHRAIITEGLDVKMKYEDHQVKNFVKKELMTAVVPGARMLTQYASNAIGEKLGVQDMKVDDLTMRLVKRFYENPKARLAILDSFADDPAALEDFKVALHVYEKRIQADVAAATTSAARHGVTKIMPTGNLRDITEAQIKRQQAAEAAQNTTTVAGTPTKGAK